MAEVKKQAAKEYYLGLDMGTDSVGWAVTTPDYEVVKKSGKALWGIRLFDAANTAAERRMMRTARRRTHRRAHRIDLLQELFAPEISKVDPGFFARLDESRLWQEDKAVDQPYSLFNDKDFNDISYHKKYPTIYHLRYALMTSDRPFDVRLVYLAIHHIIKHRGHFLFENLKPGEEGSSGFPETFQAFLNEMKEELDIDIDPSKRDSLKSILKDTGITISEKSKKVLSCFGDTRNKSLKAAASLMSGGSASISDLFGDESLKESEAKQVSFSASNYEEKEPVLQGDLGDRFELILALKGLYDWARLAELMGDSKTISEAKIKVYEKHKKDLKILKKLIRSVSYKDYYKTFKDVGPKSYSCYVGVCKVKGEKKVIPKRCPQDEFYKEITGVIEKADDSEDKAYALHEKETKNFLPLSVERINSHIPYQLHEQELKIILEKAEKYLPFLKEKDQYGTVSSKILQLLTFRLPYYIGPLSENSPYHWFVRKDKEGHIYPWNFSEKVDEAQSAENFIVRMTNTCTYLLGEKVLPKNSLLYTEFMVLNELNNVRAGAAGEKLNPDLKEAAWNELFLKSKKVTQKGLIRFLLRHGWEEKEAKIIQGIDGDFKSSLAPWIDMKKILGDSFDKDLAERIIKDITLFGMDRKMLRKRLENFDVKLTSNQIKELLRLKYSGWGRLSEKFLTGILPVMGKNVEPLVDEATGEVMNIITALRKTNLNLMEILSDTHGFSAAISRENEGKLGETLTYKTVEDLAISPAVKRPVWQSLKIIREICHIMGGSPSRIFIEMARDPNGANEKKRTVSRKDRLLALYKNCKDDTRNWAEEISKYSDSDLRSDRLYLYYTQMGKSMYTGKPIDINSLSDRNIYDIDHIYPQSKTADDSLDNRVLVERSVNGRKSDDYPLSEEVHTRMKPFWDYLLKSGLISKRKYDRLVRNTPLSDDELAAFIGRQLVETRQSTKAVTEILKNIFPDTTIVYAKAGITSRFRQYGDFVKVRELNDFHHAKDAYLNIVVGNVYYTKFTANPLNFIHGDSPRYSLKDEVLYRYPVIRNGKTAWVPGEEGTMAVVRKWMGKNNIYFTRMTYKGHGQLFNVQPVKKGKGQMPLKSGKEGKALDIAKYGGYNSPSSAYFMYVEGEKSDGTPVYILETVPMYLKDKLKTLDEKENYCRKLWKNEEDKKYTFFNPKVIIGEIPINALFSIDGYKAHITGKSKNSYILQNAEELILNNKDTEIVKAVLKFTNRLKSFGKKPQNTEESVLQLSKYDWTAQNRRKGITSEEARQEREKDLLHIYDVLLDKLSNSIYSKKLSRQAKVLVKGRKAYQSLSPEKQCVTLSQILLLFKCAQVSADLKSIGGAGRAGILTIDKRLDSKSHPMLIVQSVTGFFEKKIPLAPYRK